MPLPVFLTCALFATLLAPLPASAGDKLDRARRSIDGGGSSGSSDKRKRSHERGSRDDDDDRSFLAELLWALFVGHEDDDEDDDHHHHRSGPRADDRDVPEIPARTPYGFARYPYRYAGAAYAVPLTLEPSVAGYPAIPGPAQRGARSVGGAVSLLGGYGEGVAQGEVDARILFPSSLDMTLRLGLLHEPTTTPPGDPPTTPNDTASLGLLRLGMRFVETGNVLLRGGLSGRFYQDAYEPVGGLDAMLGLDLFLVRPFIASAEFSIGGLDRALLIEGRAQLGVALRSVELLAGYSHLSIGDAHFPAVYLGTRLWL